MIPLLLLLLLLLLRFGYSPGVRRIGVLPLLLFLLLLLLLLYVRVCSRLVLLQMPPAHS